MWKKIIRFLVHGTYRHVKTFVWETPTRENPTRIGRVYIHCFEAKDGHRRIEVGTSFSQIRPMFLVEQWSIYHELVVPWLNGRSDSEIPTYATAPGYGNPQQVTEVTVKSAE